MTICERHLYSGELPCPWPICRPIETVRIADRKFTATRFAGARDEDLYDWVADHRTAAFSLVKLSRRAVVELNGEPLAGEDRLLYHYASSATFEAILASREMWISDYRALNDTTEVSFGRGIAEQTFATFGESEVFREFLTNCLAASLNEAFFVASLSLDGDCLNQWRAYGDDCKGVSIGFGVFEFAELIARDPQAITLSRVTYDKEVQALLFRNVASLARQIVDLDEVRGKHEEAILVRELQRTISELLPICKNPAFTDERECRLIVVPCLTLSGRTRDVAVRHRQGIGGDVEYITTRDLAPNFELPMEAIVAGPWISEAAFNRVRSAAHGRALAVRRSSVPLRRPPEMDFASA